MHYRAGDYIFVLIPAIAKYEWHPFTISSAPEQAGNIDMLHYLDTSLLDFGLTILDENNWDPFY